MKTTFLKVTTILILSIFTYNANAQGCSDAGFCTLDGFKPHDFGKMHSLKSQIKFGTSYGGADNSISVLGNYVEYNRQISSKFGFDVKLTSLSQSGNGYSNFGISDLYINGNYALNEKLKFIFGGKIPLNKGDKMNGNKPLPMDYQSSLGTLDLIFGMSYGIEKLQFVLAYQQPLTQNKNQFLAENYPINSPFRQFQSTNEFIRSGDVLLRVSYPIKLGEKLRFTPSLLPIYHLSEDSYTNGLGIENEISGSQGLTLNGNAYLDYQINTKHAIQLNLAAPFIIRDSRPDGLTRSFVVNLEYKFRF